MRMFLEVIYTQSAYSLQKGFESLHDFENWYAPPHSWSEVHIFELDSVEAMNSDNYL